MNLNEIIATYTAAKAAESAAKKQADAMKKLILSAAGENADAIRTDIYTVLIKKTESVRLNTEALYHDFPDIKAEYGKLSTTTTLNVIETASIETRTA